LARTPTHPTTTTEDGLRATGIRFGDRRVMAVLELILKFDHVIDGFTNRQVVKLTSRLPKEDYTSRQAHKI
jgi:hypothetical protein